MPSSAKTFIRGSGYRFNDVHSFGDSLVHRAVPDPVLSNPGGKRLLYPVYRNKTSSPLRDALLFPCRPSAIFRGVIAVWINAINRVLCSWWQSHVEKKVVEGHPSFADSYPSAAVVLIHLELPIKAPTLNTKPGGIDLCRLSSFACHSMLCVGILRCDWLKTAARLRATVSYLVTSDNDTRSAIASTKPSGLPFALCSASGKHREAVKFLSGHINEFWHRLLHVINGDSILPIRGDAVYPYMKGL